MAFSGKIFKVISRGFQQNIRNKTRKTACFTICRNYHHYLGQKLLNSQVIGLKKYFQSPVRAMGALSPLDPSSFSLPDLAKVKHVSLKLNVDFDKNVLHGAAKLEFEVLKTVNEILLDVKELTVDSVQLEDGSPLSYTIDGNVPNYGAKLNIKLPKPYKPEDLNSALKKTNGRGLKCNRVTFSKTEDLMCTPFLFNGFPCEVNNSTSDEILDEQNKPICVDCVCNSHATIPPCCVDCKCEDSYSYASVQTTNNNRLKIKIAYTTAPSASGLQWLEPTQTAGKKHPYLFSQCQPIHARSILPCQDTPAVKFTYDAEVTAPPQFTVLMSALRSEPEGNRTVFRQPVAIPSYLLAIAVGVLENRRLGPRSLVWAEKEEVERSSWEFAETEKFLQAAEALCGKYEWTQYDLLVLPPSFPYGGMENPCLTFVTPTLLAGDRSQADVIVHEIMHSWTGNLVTNRNFEHFWLNEGFTVFLERKVAASLISDGHEARRSRDFHSLLGLQELQETIVGFLGQENPLTKLVVDLNSTHPDDAFSRVPYEKGSLFLRYLEDLVGGPGVFDDFLRAYLTKYRRQSIDTDQFKATFLEYFKDNAKAQSVHWDQWLHTAGMPPVIPDYDTSMTKAITDILPAILSSEVIPEDAFEAAARFTPHQTINLLQELIDGKALSLDKLRALGERLKLTTSRNSELKYRWLRMCIRSRDESKLDDVFDFVNNQGRMKYVRPIYRDLYDWVEVRDKAIDNFLKNEKYMMTVSAYTLRKDLHLRSKGQEVAA